MSFDKDQPVACIINSACGIYAAKALIEIWGEDLYVKVSTKRYQPLFEYIAECNYLNGETKETVFDPENEHFNENLDHLFLNMQLSIKTETGYWRTEFIEGDIFAINPDAVWDHEQDQFVMDRNDGTEQ